MPSFDPKINSKKSCTLLITVSSPKSNSFEEPAAF